MYPTPVGIYTVLAKERDVVMDSSTVGIPVSSPEGYHLTVDYAVRFTKRGLFVHSAPGPSTRSATPMSVTAASI